MDGDGCQEDAEWFFTEAALTHNEPRILNEK